MPARARGMTLIEVLVVLVLIGVVLGLATLSAGLGGPAARAEEEARRLAQLIRLQCEEALLMSREFGLHLSAEGYRFSVWDGETWLPRADARAFSDHPLPPPLGLRATVEGRELGLVSGEADRPQIVCASTGELTPFRIDFELPERGSAYRLAGALDGTLTLIPPGEFERG